MPISKRDCQLKANSVGINDTHVGSRPMKDRICGCRVLAYKSKLHLHWNDPKGACSGNNKKCDYGFNKCVCVSQSKTIFLMSFYDSF